MSGIAPAHPGHGAKLRKSEASFEPFVLVADEAVIKIDIMSDEYSVVHEPVEAVGDFGEDRRVAHHRVRDAGDLGYLRGNRPLRVDEGMPLANYLMVADLHRADFGDAIAGRPAFRCLDVDNDVILLRIETVVDATEVGADAGVAELPEPSELVAADNVAFGFHLQK